MHDGLPLAALLPAPTAAWRELPLRLFQNLTFLRSSHSEPCSGVHTIGNNRQDRKHDTHTGPGADQFIHGGSSQYRGDARAVLHGAGRYLSLFPLRFYGPPTTERYAAGRSVPSTRNSNDPVKYSPSETRSPPLVTPALTVPFWMML